MQTYCLDRTNLCSLVLLVFLIGIPNAFSAVYIVDQHHSRATDEGAGNEEFPFKSINRAAKAAKAGDTVLIRTGVYRESVKAEEPGEPDRPIIFKADTGATVIVTGADLITGWRHESNETWSVAWPLRFIGSKGGTHPGDSYHRMIGRCEQLIVAG